MVLFEKNGAQSLLASTAKASEQETFRTQQLMRTEIKVAPAQSAAAKDHDPC